MIMCGHIYTYLLLFILNFQLCWPLQSLSTILTRKSHRSLKMEIAPYKKPRRQNVPGNLYVDESCIDCDVCRWMCPSIYGRKGVKSAVIKQPVSTDDKLHAYAAMIACPVGSIRTVVSDPVAKDALNAFPAEIDPENIPGVFHLGYHSVESYGATPYLITRAAGNVMIDSPRFNEKLAKSIEQLGGLRFIILTHKDDVADHEKWQKRFPTSQRIMHRTDALGPTASCEVLLEGSAFWRPDNDLEIVHTPGHTAGSISVLFRTGKDTVLFTGDHLAYTESRQALDGFRQYNHGNEFMQAVSIRLLADDSYSFTWILPGHGRIARFASLEDKRAAVLRAADDFEKEGGRRGQFAVGYY